MSKYIGTIESTDEAWMSGQLGRDEEFVAVAPNDAEAQVNDHLELQPISIRLEKSLIEDFKLIASLNGIGYQTLMRQVLKRFADCEKKQILRNYVAERDASRKKAKDSRESPAEKKQKAA